MNNKSGSERGDGLDCKCEARSSHECGCDADWTPSEVYRLRNELSHLQKLVEEQKGEIELLRRMTQNDIVQQLMVAQNQLATQTERVRLLEKELASMIGSHGEPCADLNRGMGDCSAVKSAKQALNQESLGEGK